MANRACVLKCKATSQRRTLVAARVTIIGAGRMGQGLGLALKRRGYKVILVTRNQREVIPPLVLHQGSLAEATDGAELVLIATPDDAIPLVAGELASADGQ